MLLINPRIIIYVQVHVVHFAIAASVSQDDDDVGASEQDESTLS